MARHDNRTILFLLTMIISQRYHLSFAQQCEVTCTQTAVIRGQSYSDCLEVAQNREWELEDDFGGDLPGFLRNYKLAQRLFIKRVLGVRHLRSKRSPQMGVAGPMDMVMDLGNMSSPVFTIASTINLASSGMLSLLTGIADPLFDMSLPASSPVFTNAPSTSNIASTGLLLLLTGIGYNFYQATQSPIITSNIGRPPLGFQPLPGSPGGGGIPFENDQTGSEARELFQSLNLEQGQLPVAIFPPYADGQIFSPRTGLRSTAVIFTESNSNFRNYFKSRKWRKSSALYGLIARTYFLENKLCSLSPNAYNPCSNFNSFDPNARQGENSFVFNNPICRTTCK